MSDKKDTAWLHCSQALPPAGLVVETKIEDSEGVRNIQKLKRRNNLWFMPDDSMYVYYRPTHWRKL